MIDKYDLLQALGVGPYQVSLKELKWSRRMMIFKVGKVFAATFKTVLIFVLYRIGRGFGVDNSKISLPITDGPRRP